MLIITTSFPFVNTVPVDFSMFLVFSVNLYHFCVILRHSTVKVDLRGVISAPLLQSQLPHPWEALPLLHRNVPDRERGNTGHTPH